MSKTFSYAYMSFTVTARVGDTLEVKMGMRTQTVPLEKLRYLYVGRMGDHQELIVAYDKPDGSRGILRSYANQGDTQFKALVEDLVALKPGSDLRQTPRREALKTMGARDTQLIAAVVVPLVIVAFLGIGLSPLFVHAADEGSQRVTAGELAKTKLSSRNLVLVGELDTQRYLEVTNTKNGVKTSASYQFPVFPAGAPDDAFIPVVLQTKEISGDRIDELAEAGEYTCTLRNVLWEGMDSEDVAYMHDKLGLNVTKDTALCELSDGKGPPLIALVIGIGCTGLFVGGLIAVVMWMQRRKRG